MKSFQSLDTDEAIARMKNWLVMNLKFTVQEINDKLNCLELTHGKERLTDLAYYIQYAIIENTEYFTILETVYHDFQLYNKQHTPFRSFCYTLFYNVKTTMIKLPKRQNVI